MALTALLGGCFGARRDDAHPGSGLPPVTLSQPAVPDVAPEAMPRIEKRGRAGNPPFYDVLGKRYYVLSSSVGYVERGVASWYGPGFHKVRTSMGEIYDMYGMTAAHKTLPLPAVVRVTNLLNQRSVVVRVNDRGPFVGNRIIDLSYTAAAKLDMLHNGTAMVEVRSIDEPASSAAGAGPGGQPTAGVQSTAVPASPLFVQAGAFSDPANAERLAQKLRGGRYGKVFVREDEIAGRHMFRVRIGPVPDVAQFDHIVAALEHAGVHDAHLALD